MGRRTSAGRMRPDQDRFRPPRASHSMADRLARTLRSAMQPGPGRMMFSSLVWVAGEGSVQRSSNGTIWVNTLRMSEMNAAETKASLDFCYTNEICESGTSDARLMRRVWWLEVPFGRLSCTALQALSQSTYSIFMKQMLATAFERLYGTRTQYQKTDSMNTAFFFLSHLYGHP